MVDGYDLASDEQFQKEGWSEPAALHFLGEARRAIAQAPLKLAWSFKFGRCQRKDFPRLRTRPMYRDVELILPLVECPRRIAPWVEEVLTHRYLESVYWGEGTVINRKRGGGPLGRAKIHVVYLVITETFVRVGGDLVLRSEVAARGDGRVPSR